MKIYLIRHGKTPGNEEQRYIGTTDEPLSPRGKEALQAAKEDGFYPRVTKVFASPLKRCRETAGVIYPDLMPEIVPELRERSFGRYEGKNYQDLKDDAAYQAWVDSNGSLPFPEGEKDDAFRRRVMEGFSGALERLGQEERTALVIHGGTIMTIVSDLYGGFVFDYMVENGDYYEIDLDEKGQAHGIPKRHSRSGS